MNEQRANWCIVDDLGIVDRYFTEAEAREALDEYETRDELPGLDVEWVEDPGEL